MSASHLERLLASTKRGPSSWLYSMSCPVDPPSSGSRARKKGSPPPLSVRGIRAGPHQYGLIGPLASVVQASPTYQLSALCRLAYHFHMASIPSSVIRSPNTAEIARRCH